MDWLVDKLYAVLLPMLRPCSLWLLSPDRKRYTWVYEFWVAGILIGSVALLTTDWSSTRAALANIAAAIGVFCSFGHAKVSSRLMEAQAAMPNPEISCYRMAEHYWLFKEVAWLAAFVLSGMYSALVGNAIFLLYPVWRKIHVETRKIVRSPT